jgi:hypothetical protein
MLRYGLSISQVELRKASFHVTPSSSRLPDADFSHYRLPSSMLDGCSGLFFSFSLSVS